MGETAMAERKPDDLDGAPWWARFGLKVGIPTAMAAGAVAFVLNFMATDMKQQATALRAKIDQHIEAQSQNENARQMQEQRNEEELRALRMALDDLLSVTRQTCVNTGQTAPDRSGCFRK
jgi:hypothetical protein